MPTAPLSDASLHLAMPASCSGCNLLIAAYSYIVNPDLDTPMPSGFAADTGAETPKSAAGSFSSAGRFLHLEDRAKSVPCIRTNGVRLHRCTGCAGDRPSTWAAGLSLTHTGSRAG
jgi:hypothetical protein